MGYMEGIGMSNLKIVKYVSVDELTKYLNKAILDAKASELGHQDDNSQLSQFAELGKGLALESVKTFLRCERTLDKEEEI
jgi:hypothetical protein